MENIMAMEYLAELEAEVPATRKCLERISPELFGWKPHDRSMSMGDLAKLVGDMPRWITYIIEQSVIDFATYEYFNPKSTEELVTKFDENVKGAKNALQHMPVEALKEIFYLKNKGEVIFSSPKKENIGSSLNHFVHHRGQLTVYMRLNDIAVPSIYGPSADDTGF